MCCSARRSTLNQPLPGAQGSTHVPCVCFNGQCSPLTARFPLPSWRKLIAKLQAPPKKQKPGDPPSVKVKHALPGLASELLVAEQITGARVTNTGTGEAWGRVYRRLAAGLAGVALRAHWVAALTPKMVFFKVMR